MEKVESEIIDLRKMQIVSFVYLAILTLGSWLFLNWSFAWAVLVGGLISIGSFWVAHRDMMRFIYRLTSGDEGDEEADHGEDYLKKGKTGFILKFWLRIAIIGVILIAFLKYGKINVFGLILGLSTVVFTVTFTGLSVVGHYFIRRR